MGKSTISMAIFHCYVSSPEGSISFPATVFMSGVFLMIFDQPIELPYELPIRNIGWRNNATKRRTGSNHKTSHVDPGLTKSDWWFQPFLIFPNMG